MKPVQIKSGMTSELKFQVDIEGTTSPVTDLRLSIITAEMKISYRGQYKKGVATFKVKDLENFVQAGEIYDFNLEIYLASNYFAPLTGKIELIEPVSVQAEMIDGDSPVVNAEMSSGPTVRAEAIEDGKSEKGQSIVEEIVNRLFKKPSVARVLTKQNVVTEQSEIEGQSIVKKLFRS